MRCAQPLADPHREIAVKELWILRHAAAEASSPSGGDRSRPLSDRGRRQIDALSTLLRGFEPPGQVLLSPAQRTRETAELLFLERMGLGPTQLEIVDALYLASPELVREVLIERPGLPDRIAVVGHNPGLTDFLNELCTPPRADLPTAALARAELAIERWTDLHSVRGARSELVLPGF